LRNTTTVIKVLIAVYCLFAKELSSLREPRTKNNSIAALKRTKIHYGVFAITLYEG